MLYVLGLFIQGMYIPEHPYGPICFIIVSVFLFGISSSLMICWQTKCATKLLAALAWAFLFELDLPVATKLNP
jgi:hypothetical protein